MERAIQIKKLTEFLNTPFYLMDQIEIYAHLHALDLNADQARTVVFLWGKSPSIVTIKVIEKIIDSKPLK